MSSKNPNILIRRAIEKDLEQIARLYALFWNEQADLQKMRERFGKIQNDSRYHLLVAIQNHQVVGTIYGIICEELYGTCQPFMVMEDLVISPEYRKQGIAQALLKKLEEVALSKCCSQIQFMTESNRNDAICFYEHLGFDAKKNIGFKKKLL